MRISTVCLTLVSFALAFAGSASAEPRRGALSDLRIAKGQNTIAEAWLADPTTRYRHFVLGSPYEAASIVAKLRDGRTLKLTLPSSSVFEDRQPRLADVDGDGRDDIVLVHSYVDRGSALAVVSVVDGRLDIAYVQMPHVLGRLRLWTLQSGKLVEIASLPDASNHTAGSREIGLAAVADFDGDGVMDLAIPSLDRRWLRFISFKGEARELRRKPLPSPAVSSFSLEHDHGKPVVVVGLAGGRKVRVGY
jgi:FG-GAP-like repeat